MTVQGLGGADEQNEQYAQQYDQKSRSLAVAIAAWKEELHFVSRQTPEGQTLKLLQ